MFELKRIKSDERRPFLCDIPNGIRKLGIRKAIEQIL
jgi:hypothetical protein